MAATQCSRSRPQSNFGRRRFSRGRAFAPALWPTAAALVLCALFVRLGTWQWHRGETAQAAWARFAHGSDRLAELGGGDGTALPLFQRVRVSGVLDGAHQFLLDNRSHGGRAGYEVLTPLARAGAATLLVDRGWVPFGGSRRRLPEVSLPAAAAAATALSGRLGRLPSPGLASGRVGPAAGPAWPKLASFPSRRQLSLALGSGLAPRILLLDPQAPFGYVRDWQPPGLPPLRHFSYAIQWWAFAALAAVIWAMMSRRGARAGGAP